MSCKIETGNPRKVILFVLLFGFLASAVFACTVSSISTSSSASTATIGTSILISATLTADSDCSTNEIRLISTSGSGSLTVNDPASPGYYTGATVSSSGTIKTFTVTAGGADTYSYYVQATTTEGTTTSSSGSVQYTSSSVLTVTGEPSTQTITTADTTTINITITNPQSSAITTSYTMSYNSALVTLSGDETSATVSIPAGSQRQLQFTVTPVTTGSATISMALGSTSNAFSSTITINAVSSGTSTTTGGSANRGFGGANGLADVAATTTGTSTSSTVLDTTNTIPISYNDIRTTRTAVASAGSTNVTITLTNQGATVAEVSLSELVPASVANASQITFPSGATVATGGEGTTGTWTLAIVPGQTVTVSYAIALALTGSQASAISSSLTKSQVQVAPAKAPVALIADSQIIVGQSVTITALDPTNNRLLKAVSITVTKPSGQTLSLVTDSSGRASFVADEDGIYAYAVDGNYALQSAPQTTAKAPAPAIPTAAQIGGTPTTTTEPGATQSGSVLPLLLIAGVVVGLVVVVGGGAAVLLLLRKKKGI